MTPNKQCKIPSHSSKCLWMQAGIVRRKQCKIDFNCPECRFDKIMRRVADQNRRLIDSGKPLKGKRGRIVFWKDRMRGLPLAKRPCIHHMKGRIEFRSCTHEYRCGRCEFDQYFYDQYSVHAVVHPVDVMDIEGFKIPQGYYFHRGHTWAKIEEGPSVRVGADDFALRLLGPLDRIDAPLIGKEVEQGKMGMTLFRGKNLAELLSPVSGVVTSVNPVLRKEGSIANKDPYSNGWIMMIEPYSLRKDLRDLIINDETGDFIKGQLKRLYQVIEETAGPLAVDGGQLGYDIYGSMPELGWDNLKKKFLCN